MKNIRKQPPTEPLAFSVAAFCTLHGIGRSLFYRLLHEGRGPMTKKVGRRRLIPKAAAEAWLANWEGDHCVSACNLDPGCGVIGFQH